MKKLSKRENQIMIALWNSSVPLSASALKKNLDEDVSIYTIQQVLQKLLNEYSTHSEPHRPALRATHSII